MGWDNVLEKEMDKPAIAGGTPAKTTPFAKEKRYGAEELRELEEALEQGTLFYAHGKKVKQFEREFAELLGFKYGVAASSGTAGIHAAVIAAGVSTGDEVIVPPITDMGSIVPILYQ
ncbi:MAG TPA: DegT/DnrJ/EryC1/StrS family aminotransferase, partial [Chthoniobacteraceae bacterium]|nr:DegT/DnrJ/EryC1/StrS family aminotransferase [Chthoniobacteraceae bacterium]